jgi:hypothetical protein
MHDELGDLWIRYGALLARLTVLEEIADRLAVTCVDPIAIADYERWKGTRSG